MALNIHVGHGNKGIDHQMQNIFMLKQTLPTNTIRERLKTVKIMHMGHCYWGLDQKIYKSLIQKAKEITLQ